MSLAWIFLVVGLCFSWVPLLVPSLVSFTTHSHLPATPRLSRDGTGNYGTSRWRQFFLPRGDGGGALPRPKSTEA